MADAPGRRSYAQLLLRRTSRAGFHPGFDQRTSLLLRAGRGAAAGTGGPGPANQRIFADMMDEFFNLAPAIARRILELRADFRNRFALPRHFARCKVPFRMARHTAGLEVCMLVANRTAHRRKAMAVRAAHDRRLMQAALVTLPRSVAGGMAIHAARMGQHLAQLG